VNGDLSFRKHYDTAFGPLQDMILTSDMPMSSLVDRLHSCHVQDLNPYLDLLNDQKNDLDNHQDGIGNDENEDADEVDNAGEADTADAADVC